MAPVAVGSADGTVVRIHLDIMRAIKRALAPKGIMCPGKVIRVDPGEPVRGGSTIR